MKKLTKLVYEGKALAVEFYCSLSGECFAQDWLEQQAMKKQQSFAALFAWIGDHGKIWNEQKFKHLTGSDKLFEFKSDGGRILCFFIVGKRLILTHGFTKKSNKTPPGEIQKAGKIKNDFLLRERNKDEKSKLVK